MPHRALAERRPWLLASLFFGVTFWFVSNGALPGAYQIAWKGAGVGLLAAYAWAHHPSRSAHWIAWVMAFGALGDMVLELDFTLGALAFFMGHMIAIGLYLKNRRASPSASQKGLGAAALVGIPLIAWLLTRSPQVAFYALALGGMAASAWLSSFPCYRVGLGAMMFAASDLLIFARMGALADSALPHLLIWPLYYFGQFLICVGVIGALKARGEFSAE